MRYIFLCVTAMEKKNKVANSIKLTHSKSYTYTNLLTVICRSHIHSTLLSLYATGKKSPVGGRFHPSGTTVLHYFLRAPIPAASAWQCPSLNPPSLWICSLGSARVCGTMRRVRSWTRCLKWAICWIECIYISAPNDTTPPTVVLLLFLNTPAYNRYSERHKTTQKCRIPYTFRAPATLSAS